MSTAWYFHTFGPERLDKVWGRATPAQVRRLAAAMTDPGERDEPDDDQRLAICTAIVRALTDRPAYDGLSRADATHLDDVVQSTFRPSGFERYLGAKPVSPEAVNIWLAAHLATLAGRRWPDPLLPLLANGRRVGGGRPALSYGYLILTSDEADRMHAEAAELIADPATPWADSHAAGYTASALLPALAAVHRADGLSLYGVLT